MSNRFKVFTGKTSKDTEERLAEVSLSKRGGLADPYQDRPQPTGRDTAGEAPQFSRFDHSHPTVILPELDDQLPVDNEIRFNTSNKLIRWDEATQSWVPLSVEVASNTLPQPAGGNPSAGTSLECSRADHRHSIVLEPIHLLSYPTGQQLGVMSSFFDDIGHLSLAIYNGSQSRWELPFGRPLLSQTAVVPSGKGFYSTVNAELALRTNGGAQGILYFRRYGLSTWEPIGVVVQHSSYVLGIVGELLRTSADISPSGQWYLRGRDDEGNVRALPLSVRTYNQNNKPTTNLPLNTDDAYGFFIQDRRLIELYPQQTDGVDFPVMLTGYQIGFPLRPALFGGTGANTIIESNFQGLPALEFQGSTANGNIPFFTTQGVFLPMGIRRVRFQLLLRNYTSNNHTFVLRLRLLGWNNTTSITIAEIANISVAINASSNTHFISVPVLLTLTDTYSPIGGLPLAIQVFRRWDLETTNTNPLVVGMVGLVAVRE